mmetsp:Transcript_10730/g.16450  ORF Transcript_10730/g.16450 Transcript_10730/m.16450 type:complete len:98 (-) Transcript_10730:103-396(-)
MKLSPLATLVAVGSSLSPATITQLRAKTSLAVSREEYFQPHFIIHEQQQDKSELRINEQNERVNAKDGDPVSRSSESTDLLEYRLARLHEIADFEEH